MATRASHRYLLHYMDTYGEKIDALRTVFATPGVHELKDIGGELDRIEAEARSVVLIHQRDAVVERLNRLTLRITVNPT